MKVWTQYLYRLIILTPMFLTLHFVSTTLENLNPSSHGLDQTIPYRPIKVRLQQPSNFSAPWCVRLSASNACLIARRKFANIQIKDLLHPQLQPALIFQSCVICYSRSISWQDFSVWWVLKVEKIDCEALTILLTSRLSNFRFCTIWYTTQSAECRCIPIFTTWI